MQSSRFAIAKDRGPSLTGIKVLEELRRTVRSPRGLRQR